MYNVEALLTLSEIAYVLLLSEILTQMVNDTQVYMKTFADDAPDFFCIKVLCKTSFKFQLTFNIFVCDEGHQKIHVRNNSESPCLNSNNVRKKMHRINFRKQNNWWSKVTLVPLHVKMLTNNLYLSKTSASIVFLTKKMLTKNVHEVKPIYTEAPKIWAEAAITYSYGRNGSSEGYGWPFDGEWRST